LLRYKIYRGSDSTNVVLLDSTTSTFYTDAGLTSGRKYYYRVSATDATGFEGAKGFAVSATTLSLTGEYTSDANTVLLLHMDELVGTDVPDASTFNTGGTATGTTVAAGRFGNARSFDGTLDYVEGLSNNLTSAGQNFTLEAWINTISSTGGAIFTTHNPGAGKYSNLGLYLAGGTGGGYFDIDINNGQGTSASNFNGRKINDGQWHHIAGVRSGMTISLYVDGKLDFQKSIQEPNPSTLYRIAQNYPGGFFQGLIDEIRISNKARLPNEFDLQLPPVNLSATPASNAINLSWLNGGGANEFLRYKIYRGTDSTNVALIDSTTSGTYANSGLTNGKTYYYRISAVDVTGFEGEKSYARSATIPGLAGEYTADISTLLLLHLDEATGPISVDASSFTINGTATGTSPVTGRFGNARSFNGTTDFIEGYPSNMNFAGQDFTVEAWIKSSSSAAQAIFTTHNPSTGSLSNTGLYILAGSGMLDMDINNGQGASASSSNGRNINDGLWHHVAGVRRSSSITLYVDGKFDSQKAVTQEPNPSVLYRVGKSYTSNFFNGIIEEVRVSGVARQPGEFKLQLPPVNIAATVGGNIVSLTWQNGGGGIGLLRYKIYRGTDSTNVTLLDSTTTTSYSNSGLTPGRIYFYRISAVDALAFEGAKSNATSAMIPALAGEYSADATTSLLLHMNESTGSVVSDATSYNSHGAATGTSITFGRFGNARSFNGTSDFIEGSSPNLNFAGQGFTLEAWIKTSSTSGQAILTTHNTSTGTSDNLDLVVTGGAGNGFLDMNINGGQGSPALNDIGHKINDGKWHHVAGVRFGGIITLYVDGRFDFLKLVTQDPRISTIYRVGQMYSGSFFNGVIDEVRLSSKARQPGEFNLQLPPADLVATTVGTTIGLRWSNGGGGIGLLRYRIYRGLDSTNVAFLDSTTSTSYTNVGLLVGRTYFYRVSAVDAVGNEGAMSYAASGTTVLNAIDLEAIPDEFALYQNYPNPFNPSTRIVFAVPKTTRVQLRVLDLLGREVAVLVNGERAPGTYEVQWDAGTHPSGMYICRIQAGEFVQMRKMTLIK
jgi:fibronectin type 3 domain-containing protein